MTFKTILRYQLGNDQAIRAVAGNRSSLWAGMILVFTAAVARNYDQTFILEEPYWPIVPLVFSFFSGFFVFLFVHPLCLKPAEGWGKEFPGFRQQFPPFLALFWMTAPLAWLYALPVERFLSTRHAAVANLCLFAVVAIWRVLLLTRVVHVLADIPFRRSLFAVLLAASVEWFVLSLAGFASLLDVMSGLRHSPEKQLLGGAVALSFWGSMVLAFIAGVGVRTSPAGGGFLHTAETGRFPKKSILVVVLLWLAAAIRPQIEVSRNYHVERLVKQQRTAEALAFLSRHTRADFSPSRRLFPDPYTWEVFGYLPRLFEAMSGSETAWVRQEYLRHLEIMLKHDYDVACRDLLQIARSLERIPKGKDWVAEHRTSLERIRLPTPRTDQEKKDELALVDQFKKLGVELQHRSR